MTMLKSYYKRNFKKFYCRNCSKFLSIYEVYESKSGLRCFYCNSKVRIKPYAYKESWCNMKQILLIFIALFLVLGFVFIIGAFSSVKTINGNTTGITLDFENKYTRLADSVMVFAMYFIASAIFFLIALGLLEVYIKWYEG